MEIFTIEEFQERWDELIGRVENGEKLGIINESGQAAIMMPIEEYHAAKDELTRIHTTHDDAS
jgi:PHD/YefM family antitoxin component YafN of YafNO toxin-antitoxin module